MPVLSPQGFTDCVYKLAKDVVYPGLQNSQFEYASVLKHAIRHSRNWLDLGCGHEHLPGWMKVEDRQLPLITCRATGIDTDSQSLRQHPSIAHRVLGNIESLPFQSESFDLLTANMVLEHVGDPARLFHEAFRVLQPGGRMIVHTPNLAGYTTVLTRLIPARLRPLLARILHGRDSKDVYPTYYRANRRAVLRDLARDSGLRVLRIDYVVSSPQLVRLPPLMLIELLLIRTSTKRPLRTLSACLIAEFHR